MEERNIVTEIERIVKESRIGSVVEIQGRTFLIEEDGAREINEKEYLLDDRIELTDLKSFCEIIKEEIHKLGTKLFIQVVDHRTVKAFTTLDHKNRRCLPYICICNGTKADFNTFAGYEEFVINLRANFVPTDDTTNVIKMIANIVNCDNQEMTDDGVSQSVRTQRGTQVGMQEVKSIIKLAPFRTFPEIAQPTSEFLFRIKDNGTRFGLFEADGGRWKLEAKNNIAEFIKKEFEYFVEKDLVKVLL